MNYLGHFHLASHSKSLIAGNLLGEYVHGLSAQKEYSKDIWEGIQMHRHIDSYTDQHPSARKISEFFRNDFKRYAPVMTDIAIDYLLASDPKRYPTQSSLHGFAQKVYSILQEYKEIFPLEAQEVVENMQHYDWLTQYRSYEGISKAFGYIIYRASYLDPKPSAQTAIQILQKYESELRREYTVLMTDIEKQF